jgi:hypothetical protein
VIGHHALAASIMRVVSDVTWAPTCIPGTAGVHFLQPEHRVDASQPVLGSMFVWLMPADLSHARGR